MNYQLKSSLTPASPKPSLKSNLRPNEPEESESICRDFSPSNRNKQLAPPPSRPFRHRTNSRAAARLLNAMPKKSSETHRISSASTTRHPLRNVEPKAQLWRRPIATYSSSAVRAPSMLGEAEIVVTDDFHASELEARVRRR